jgi:hypothetical protein
MVIRLFKQYGISNYELVNEFVSDVISEVVLRKTPIHINTNVMGYFWNLSRNLIFRHLRYKIRKTNNHENLNDHLETLPCFDQAIPIWELEEIIGICLKMLSKRERELMEGLIAKTASEELVQQLGFKNVEVLYTESYEVKKKFRGLLQSHGVDSC